MERAVVAREDDIVVGVAKARTDEVDEQNRRTERKEFDFVMLFRLVCDFWWEFGFPVVVFAFACRAPSYSYLFSLFLFIRTLSSVAIDTSDERGHHDG